jgi:hypothetical protein
VSVVQTVLIYVLIPAAVYSLVALLVFVPRKSRLPRYRPGQEWTYDPVWWTANPAGHNPDGTVDVLHAVASRVEHAPVGAGNTARGGARGNW